MFIRRFPTTGRVLVLGAVLATLATGPATAASTAGSPAASVDASREEAIALARAGVAKRQDVPAGFEPQARSLAGRKKDLAQFRADEASFYRCLGFAQPAYLARAFGQKFTTKTAEVVSTADVTTSVAAARKNMTIHHDESGPRCYRLRLANALRRNNVDGDVVVRQVAFDVPGAEETYAYRTTLTVRGQQGTRKAEALLVGSRVGPVLTTVSFSLVPGQQIAGKTIQKVAATPVGRVRRELNRQADRRS